MSAWSSTPPAPVAAPWRNWSTTVRSVRSCTSPPPRSATWSPVEYSALAKTDSTRSPAPGCLPRLLRRAGYGQLRRPEAQRLRRPGALPAARGRRVAARRARASRSTIRRPTRRCSRPWSATWCRPQTGACPVAAQHQRSRVHRCPRRSVHRGDTMRSPRAELVERFRDMADRGELIVGGGAVTGLSAKCEEAGGIDLIVIYNSGRYRMAGRGSLAGMMPYGDANAIVMAMAAEVLTVVRDTPVLAGVCGTDPFRRMEVFLDEVIRVGFAGVQNFPTVGLIDGVFRQNLEETGMGYGLEVELIAAANRKGLLTTPYVFSEEDARAMAAAGADIIVCHMGLTTGGSVGAGTALKLAECPDLVD